MNKLFSLLTAALMVLPSMYGMQNNNPAPAQPVNNRPAYEALLTRFQQEQAEYERQYATAESEITTALAQFKTPANVSTLQQVLKIAEDKQRVLLLAIGKTVDAIQTSAFGSAQQMQTICLACWKLQRELQKLPLQALRTRITELQRITPMVPASVAKPAASIVAPAVKPAPKQPSIPNTIFAAQPTAAAAASSASAQVANSADEKSHQERLLAEIRASRAAQEEVELKKALELSLQEQQRQSAPAAVPRPVISPAAAPSSQITLADARASREAEMRQKEQADNDAASQRRLEELEKKRQEVLTRLLPSQK